MGQQYRYRPRENRTPVNHPTIGHLEWDGIYDSPDCAGNPDFEPVDSASDDVQDVDPGTDSTDTTDDPTADAGGDTAADDESADPAAKRTGAGKPGRSTK